jgi:hypothetical protein
MRHASFAAKCENGPNCHQYAAKRSRAGNKAGALHIYIASAMRYNFYE